MKRHLYVTLILIILAGGLSVCPASAQESKREDPTQAFYTANHYYQNQDYIKAVEEYLKLLDMGLESGNLYYNIGNGFLKLGKVGHAILCYEKARRFIPHDSDLRSNIEYARSLVDDTSQGEPHRNIVIRLLLRAYEDFNLSSVALMTLVSYIALVALLMVFAINPLLSRRFGFIAWLLGLYFAVTAVAFGLRYYGEVHVKHGVIVQKSIGCKYEPIDNSTTYYTLKEGAIVRILKTKDDWRQIRRSDGKIGWIKKGSAEEI